MYKYLVSCSTMHRNAAVLMILCILLCLTFNYTFPLHRQGTKWFMNGYSNQSRICPSSEHRDNIVERTKKMATNIENAFRRFKDSRQDYSKNVYAHLNTGKNSLSEEDLRQYEQLVIMKKYPYLDLKEIELKFGPSEKITRQSIKYDGGNNYAGDPSFCEPLEDIPNVEITNRGLTGFAIPAKIIKATKFSESKMKAINNVKFIEDRAGKQNLKFAVTSAPRVLESLHNDVMNYE